MTAHITDKYQVIEYNGKPAFVIVPYNDYLAMSPPPQREPGTPNEIVAKHFGEGKSLIQSWREYLDLTQEEMSCRMGIKQASYQQLEKKTARPRLTTLKKVAEAFGIDVSLLTWNR